MIRFKIFPISEYDEANKFMEKNPPRSTDKQSGVIFHEGNFVIIYDDGKEHPTKYKDTIAHELEGKRTELWLTEHKKTTNQIVLDELVPKGYEFAMDSYKVEKLIMADGLSDSKTIKSIIEKIANAENEILLANHEGHRLEIEIKAYEKELKEVSKK